MVKGFIRQRDEIDEMQFDFMSGCGTTYAFYCMSPIEEADDCYQASLHDLN